MVTASGVILNALLACLGCAAVVVLGLLWLRRALGNSLLRGMPRLQQRRFVERLRTDAFADPVRVVGTLSGNNAAAYLHGLWTGAKDDTRRAAADVARNNPGAASRLRAVTETTWPAAPLTARPVPIGGGWSLVVVSLPPPERNNEAYFVGIAVPAETPSGDGAAAHAHADPVRRGVRFFQLNKWSLDRDTDLVEHTTSGRELTYNVGTEQKVEAFAAAIAGKVHARPR